MFSGDLWAKTDAELLFLGSYRATSHQVLFGALRCPAHPAPGPGPGCSMNKLGELQGEANIARPGDLLPHTAYRWQVISTMPDESTRAGPIWSFSTASGPSCSNVPPAGEGWTPGSLPVASTDTCDGLPARSGKRGGR